MSVHEIVLQFGAHTIPAARCYRHFNMTIYLFTSILSMSNERGSGRAVGTVKVCLRAIVLQSCEDDKFGFQPFYLFPLMVDCALQLIVSPCITKGSFKRLSRLIQLFPSLGDPVP